MWVVAHRLEGARVRETGRLEREWARDPLTGSYQHYGLDPVWLSTSSATLGVAVWDVGVAVMVADTLRMSMWEPGNL